MADVKIKKVDFIEGYARKFGDFGHAMQENVRKCGQMTDQYEDRLRELQKRIEESCVRIEQNLKKAQGDLERLYESDDLHPAGFDGGFAAQRRGSGEYRRLRHPRMAASHRRSAAEPPG